MPRLRSWDEDFQIKTLANLKRSIKSSYLDCDLDLIITNLDRTPRLRLLPSESRELQELLGEKCTERIASLRFALINDEIAPEEFEHERNKTKFFRERISSILLGMVLEDFNKV
jgi:hypothetical protein